jgi:hypothetical protein
MTWQPENGGALGHRPLREHIMTPTIIFCSWLAGRCFALNVEATAESFTACEARITRVETMAAELMSRGILPADLYIYQKECAI